MVCAQEAETARPLAGLGIAAVALDAALYLAEGNYGQAAIAGAGVLAGAIIPAATLAVVAKVAKVARSGRLVHLTGAAAEIVESGTLIGKGGIYATSEATAGCTGLSLAMRTGLMPGAVTSAVPIPASAVSAFSKPIPIGLLTGAQRLFGTQYTAAGTLNLATGAFTRTGVNWNQVSIYAFDAMITSGAVAGGYLAATR